MSFGKELLHQLLILILAGTPLSLLVIYSIQHIFFKQNKKLGAITTICTPVIGTLTKNQLTVQSLVFDKYQLKTEENSEFLTAFDKLDKKSFKVEQRELKKEMPVNIMAATINLCHYPKHHKIEAIISDFFTQCNLHKDQIETYYDVIQEIPSTKDKKISTIIVIKKETDEIFAFNKGNPRRLLQRCTKIMINGKKEELTNDMRRRIIRNIKNLNKRGQKLIAFSFKGLPLKRYEQYTEAFSENDLTFIGMVGLGNFLNTEVSEKIETVKKAGIKIYILGQNEEREEVGIAEELKIINPKYFETISSENLADLNDQKLAKMLENKEKDYVFFGLTEADQRRVVSVLEQSGEKVLMINNNEKSDLKMLSEQITKGRALNYSLQKVFSHILFTKFTTITLLLTTIVLKAPLPLTIGIILILDMIISLGLELVLEQQEEVKGKKNKESYMIFRGIMAGILISTVYIWNLMRFGWYPGEIMTTHGVAIESSLSLVFLLLATNSIISSYQISKSISQYLVMATAGIIIILYSLLEFSFIGLRLPDGTELIMILFVIVIGLLIDKVYKHLIKKYGSN